MKARAPFTVRIFVPYGDPDGLRFIEKANWVGLGLVFPRSEFSRASKRGELSRPGVYVLWGPDEEREQVRVYIGEGEQVLTRLSKHHQSKDFWTHAAVFAGKDDSLNKASIKYLEAKLIELAKKAGIALLDNSQNPSPPALSEPDRANADLFLHDMLLCLPLAGADFFKAPQITRPEKKRLFYIAVNVQGLNIQARGYQDGNRFVVLKGSKATKRETPSTRERTRRTREQLLEMGVLQNQGEYYVFTRDHAFNSPSQAAGAILSGSRNGRELWTLESGKTLKQVQEEEAKAAGGSA